jgi:hypothetical protein
VASFSRTITLQMTHICVEFENVVSSEIGIALLSRKIGRSDQRGQESPGPSIRVAILFEDLANLDIVGRILSMCSVDRQSRSSL